MSKQNHTLQLGARVSLSYPYVGPNSHLCQIVRTTPSSVLIQLDGEERTLRFLIRNRQWRNEFGRAVSINLLLQPDPITR
jgi:hypothetical protein